MAQCHPEPRIFLVDKLGRLDVAPIAAVSIVARGNNHIKRMSLLHGSLHRNTVNDAPVEHRLAVHHHHLAHKGQRTAGTTDSRHAVAVGLVAEILRPSRGTVGRHHLKDRRVVRIGLPVERDEFVGKLVVKQFWVEDTPLLHQVAQPDVLILVEHVDIGESCPARLSADIGQTVAGPRRYRHHIAEPERMFHESVEHPTGEDPSHTAPFEHQSCIVIDKRHNLC